MLEALCQQQRDCPIKKCKKFEKSTHDIDKNKTELSRILYKNIEAKAAFTLPFLSHSYYISLY